MGNSSLTPSSVKQKVVKKPMPVRVHIYDIGTGGAGKALNSILRPLGTGVFHCGVEVYDTEWSYGDGGVYDCIPTKCEGHTYCDSIQKGRTKLSFYDTQKCLRLLQQWWRPTGYDLLTRNCCHFAGAFCEMLGVGGLPAWITNLADLGAAITAGREGLCTRRNLDDGWAAARLEMECNMMIEGEDQGLLEAAASAARDGRCCSAESLNNLTPDEACRAVDSVVDSSCCPDERREMGEIVAEDMAYIRDALKTTRKSPRTREVLAPTLSQSRSASRSASRGRARTAKQRSLIPSL